MPTISSKVNKNELDAITEYANACDETVSNMIRKTVLGEAVFLKVYWDAKEYDCKISVPENISGDEENRIVLGSINRARRILGLKEQEEI